MDIARFLGDSLLDGLTRLTLNAIIDVLNRFEVFLFHGEANQGVGEFPAACLAEFPDENVGEAVGLDGATARVAGLPWFPGASTALSFVGIEDFLAEIVEGSVSVFGVELFLCGQYRGEQRRRTSWGA